MKVLGFGGLPAVGKSAIFKELIFRTGGLNGWLWVKSGLIVWHESIKYRAVIIGDYSGRDGFVGTDKLSMAVQPTVIFNLLKWKREGHKRYVLFEGDRLFNMKFFRMLDEHSFDYDLHEVIAEPKVISLRHAQRADTQTTSWLAGRRTKIENIAERYALIKLRNDNQHDLDRNVQNIMNLLEEP